MKLNCDRKKLCEALSKITRAVSSKSTIPALEGILLKGSEGILIITGYDLELGISTEIECEVEQPGAIVLPARLFYDIARRIPSDEICISSTERFMTTIEGGQSEFKIMGIDPVEFPEIPRVQQENTVTVHQAVLKNMVDQTLFAVAVNDTKPAHKGTLFQITNKTLTLVSVDGYRLALRRELVNYDSDLSFIVPGKTLGELSKLLSEEEEDTVDIHVTEKHIFFTVSGYFMISRLLEGDFLDYEKAIPQKSSTEVTVDVRALADSIERVSLLITDRLKSPVKCEFHAEGVQLFCQTTVGNATDIVGAKKDGEDVEIGFNSKYLLDALHAACCDQVRLLLGGPLHPMKVMPCDGDSFLFLVLPVRLTHDR